MNKKLLFSSLAGITISAPLIVISGFAIHNKIQSNNVVFQQKPNQFQEISFQDEPKDVVITVEKQSNIDWLLIVTLVGSIPAGLIVLYLAIEWIVYFIQKPPKAYGFDIDPKKSKNKRISKASYDLYSEFF